jgi:hypothetical protein
LNKLYKKLLVLFAIFIYMAATAQSVVNTDGKFTLFTKLYY